MDGGSVITVLICVLAFAAVGIVLVMLRGNTGGKATAIRGLMPSFDTPTLSSRGTSRKELFDADDDEFDLNAIKQRTGKSRFKSQGEDINSKLFKAGYFTLEDRRKFSTLRVVVMIIAVFVGPTIAQIVFANPLLVGVGVLFGAFVGYALPISLLERKIRARQEETMYYLPLVIEQISIGVSSSLDIGPCISEVVKMADDRDSHNPVTEMFIHTEKLMRSGLSLEEGLIEVAEVNGSTEVKHAFMFLSQCAKHGGEISKQLQELADATMVQRQVYVEGRIAALPVKATGPLATVFGGFFGLLFAGLLVRLLDAFGGGGPGSPATGG